MAFPILSEALFYFDVYPKVVRAGSPVEITIRSKGGRFPYKPGDTCDVTIKALFDGEPSEYPSGNYVTKKMTCAEDGSLHFTHTFETEQEYFLDFAAINYSGNPTHERLSVYCVADDLCGLYPFIGDLHMHTIRSDGSQQPTTVCANYRRHGYDFMVVSDHCYYYPSLEAIRFYKDIPTELCIVPGEEVHMPAVGEHKLAPHIVNFGGEYSVNALVERDDYHNPEWKKPENRSIDGKCPEIMSKEAFDTMLKDRAKTLTVPEGVDPVTVAGISWIFETIRKAGGLGIYPHPTWISDTFHVPDVLHRYMVENKLFDAFEVLGGENYFEQNGYQTVQYYEDKARGYRYPIVGSTDSHSSLPTNRNGFICSTIVFAKKNERKAIIDAVKDFRSVAVDTISKEFRIVGEMRLVRYACFLLKNYFPLHDELCYEEGRLMLETAVGSKEEKEQAIQVLSAIHGRIHKMQEKYFSF